MPSYKIEEYLEAKKMGFDLRNLQDHMDYYELKLKGAIK